MLQSGAHKFEIFITNHFVSPAYHTPVGLPCGGCQPLLYRFDYVHDEFDCVLLSAQLYVASVEFGECVGDMSLLNCLRKSRFPAASTRER